MARLGRGKGRPRREPHGRGRGTIVVLFVVAGVLAGCGDAPSFRGPSSLSAALTPPPLGALTFAPQTKLAAATIRATGSDALVTQGAVYLIEDGKYTAGSVEVYLLKPDVRVEDAAVLAGLDSGISGSLFKRVRLVPDQVMWEKDAPVTRTYIWFPPRANAVEIVTVRKDFQVDQQMVTALVDQQHGRTPQHFTVPPPPTPPPPAVIIANPDGSTPSALPTTVLPAQPTP